MTSPRPHKANVVFAISLGSSFLHLHGSVRDSLPWGSSITRKSSMERWQAGTLVNSLSLWMLQGCQFRHESPWWHLPTWGLICHRDACADPAVTSLNSWTQNLWAEWDGAHYQVWGGSLCISSIGAWTLYHLSIWKKCLVQGLLQLQRLRNLSCHFRT
jgi:hypothetical protein